jgi:hypothetical protein
VILSYKLQKYKKIHSLIISDRFWLGFQKGCFPEKIRIGGDDIAATHMERLIARGNPID